MKFMEEVKKLEEILTATGWSQATLAGMIEVSAKSLNSWLNGKSAPQKKRAKKIDEVYDKVMRPSKTKIFETQNNFDTKILKGILLEEQAKEDAGDKTKRMRAKRKKYFDGKIVARKLEENNYSRIILFPSRDGEDEDEWYKVGGNSVLFYKYYIGPRMGRKPVIHDDTDMQQRFKNGIAIIHWGEKFVEDVQKVGCVVQRSEFGLIIATMDKKFSPKEVEEIQNREKRDKDKVQKMITPKENFPDIYGLIRNLAQILPPKVKKMDGAYREVFGNRLLTAVAELYKIYFKMGNGRIERFEALQKMQVQMDDIAAILAIVDENKLFDLATRVRVGETLVDLKNTIVRRLV